MNRGFTHIIIILVVVALLGVGVGGFVLISKKTPSTSILPLSSQNESIPTPLSSQTETAPVSSPSNQTSKIGTPPPATANPTELLGWWEEIESWSIDPQSGNLKKDASSFPFLHEFTDKYFCTQYSAKFTCANNIFYSVNGNNVFLEGVSSLFYEWRISGGRLELVSKDSKGRMFGRSLSKKIGPPTSKSKITAPAVTRPGIPAEPKASIKLLKVGESGVCLKHDGGDSIPMTQLGVKLNGNSASIQSIEQFPKLTGDYIFDAGEFFVLAVMPPAPERFITFRVGDTVEIVDSIIGSTFFGPKKIEKIEPRDEDAPMLIGGLASCS